MKFNVKTVATPLLLVASDEADIKVAVYATESGDKLVANAGLDLYSPVDGTPMKAVAADHTETMPAAYVAKKLVPLGSCTGCAAKLVASATLADHIETAGNGLHCPRCATEVTPQLDMNRMLACLAAEYEDDSDEDFGSDDEDMSDDADMDADDGDMDDDADMSDDSDMDDGDDFGDDDMDDDEDFDDDMDDEDDLDDDMDDEDGEFASDDEAAPADEAPAADDAAPADEAPAEDAPVADEDDGSTEIASARKIASRARRVAAVGKRKARRFKMKATAGEDVVDENGEPDDGEAEAIASKQLFAIASRLRKEGMKKRAAFKAQADDDMGDEMPADDSMGDDADMADDVAPVTASAKKVKKTFKAKAGDEGSRDDSTPGTDDTSGTPASDAPPPPPPGTNEDKPNDDHSADGNGDDSSTGTTPGTDAIAAVAGDLTVDWAKAPIELVASQHGDNVFVVAGGRPVAFLDKAKACETIQGQWKSPLLTTAFITVARAGLKAEAASEFGFTPITYKVQANDVMRNTIRRATEVASQRATEDARAQSDKFKQSVKTAALGSIKGVFPEVKNPMRTALIASLRQLGVNDAANVVDRAMANSVDDWAVGVFAKADELMNKPEAARNEVASFVATARFQVERASDALSANLAAGSSAALPQPSTDVRATAGADKAPATQSDRVRLGLASIQRR